MDAFSVISTLKCVTIKFLLVLIENPFFSELHVLITKLNFRPDYEYWNINSLSEIFSKIMTTLLNWCHMCIYLQYSYVNIFISIFSYLWTTAYAYNGIVK